MYSFGPRCIKSLVYGIISWCTMCRLFQTSDSDNFLLEIQATSTSLSSTLTFGMCTQNLELRGMEPSAKFCNWIRLSSWEYRYSQYFIIAIYSFTYSFRKNFFICFYLNYIIFHLFYFLPYLSFLQLTV